MKELAVYMMLKMGGTADPSAEDVTKALDAVGIEADAESLELMLSQLAGKDMDELMTLGRAKLATFGGGGGGGGGGDAAAGGAEAAVEEEKKEEEEEEEEIDMGGGMDMFGDGGGGDDY